MKPPRIIAGLLLVLGPVLLLGLCASGLEAAPVPSVLSYDGYLTDPDGHPVATGRRDITFSLYAEATGGTPLWTETHEKVLINGGTFHVILGRGTVPRPLELPFDRAYFLGIQLGTDPELSPRQELMPGAYSHHAKIADAVADESVDTRHLRPLSVTDDNIKSVSWSKITGVDDASHGVAAQVWSLRGNRVGAGLEQFLGTVDEAPLVFRTGNQPRMSIQPTGEIEAHAQFMAHGPILSQFSTLEGAFFLGDQTSGLTRSDDGASLRLFSTDGALQLGNGAATIEGNASILGNLTTSGSFNVTGPGSFDNLSVTEMRVGNLGASTWTAPLHVARTDHGASKYVAVFENRSGAADGHGIAVVAGDDVSSHATNYVSFYNGSSAMKGRIEGETWGEALLSPDYLTDAGALVAKTIITVAFSWKEWGAVLSQAVDVVAFGVKTGFKVANAGVTYASGAGDYAEWLPRLDADEALTPGQVVGVFGGRVTRTTRGAERILVVSTNPILLGNMPDPGEEHRFAKVAFLGQVPVAVVGAVEQGDYLIPSGRGDGAAIAVAPHLMTSRESQLVIGRAWQSSSATARKLINTAVGLHPGELAPLLSRTEAQVADLEAEVRAHAASLGALNARMADLEARLSGLGTTTSFAAGPATAPRVEP